MSEERVGDMTSGSWSKQDVAFLVELAKDPHVKISQAAKALNRKSYSVANKAKRLNIDSKWNTCQYDFDLNFFKKHTANLWYFIGFFFADGGITPQQFGFWLLKQNAILRSLHHT